MSLAVYHIGHLVTAVMGLHYYKKYYGFCQLGIIYYFCATKQVVLGFKVPAGLLIAIWGTEN